MVPARLIEDFARRVAQVSKPDRIVLFGSHAYGDPADDSDVDILVVLPFEGKAWKKAAEIRMSVRAGFPLDLIVRTPEEFAERVAAGDPFFQEVAAKGKVLYGA